MKITKTEIKNHIEGKDPVATYYGGLAGLGLEIYETTTTPDDDYVYFVEVAGTKETPKKIESFYQRRWQKRLPLGTSGCLVGRMHENQLVI